MESTSTHIFVELANDILPRVKRRTELFMRGRPEINEEQIITERDMDILGDFFMDFIAEFRSQTGRGTKDKLKDYENQFVIKLTENEKKLNISELKQFVAMIAEEYHLFRWYDALGEANRAEYHRNRYEENLRKWKYNGSQKKMITPAYRPYF